MNDSPPPDMQKLPAARGLAWLAGSWGLVRRQPVRLLLISLFFQFFLGFSQADLLGLLVVMCLPVLSAGMLQAFYLVEAGERPMLAVLFMPFTVRHTVGRLLILGGVVLVLGLLLVSALLAGQIMEIDPQLLSRVEQGDLDALQYIDPAIMEKSLLAMALAAAVSGMLTYFAVPLIWFRKQAMGRAVVSGLKALGRNWKPLLLIGVLLGLLAVPVAMLVGYFSICPHSVARLLLPGWPFYCSCLDLCFNYCCLAPSTWRSGTFLDWASVLAVFKKAALINW